jgi:hypothetical protein
VRILEGYVWLCTKRPDRVEAAAQTFADVLEEVKVQSPPTLHIDVVLRAHIILHVVLLAGKASTVYSRERRS